MESMVEYTYDVLSIDNQTRGLLMRPDDERRRPFVTIDKPAPEPHRG